MTATAKPLIAVIGSNMVDLVTYVKRMPVRGETVEAPTFESGHGGKGANQAVAAAKLGASVVMVTAVGDDMFADATIRNLEAVGVDTAHVRRVKGKPSGVAPIMVEPNGENSILIVKGANADLSPGDIDRAADVLKTCDLILMQLEVPLETVYVAIAFGKRHGVKTVLTESNSVTGARRLLNKGFETVIVTLGSRGALLTSSTNAQKIEPVAVK